MSTTTTEPGPLADGTAAFPRPAVAEGPSGEQRWDNLVYSCEAGYRPLFLDLRVPALASSQAPAPVVIWVHGGGWVFGSRRRQAPNLHQNAVIETIVDAGYAVALVDYRLAKEAPFPAQLLDLKAAVRWLRGNAPAFNLDPGRFAVWGESAGAHLAAMLGFCDKDPGERTGECLEQSEEVQAVVDWYGPTDLAEFQLADGALPSDSEETGVYTEHPLRTLLDGSRWTMQEISPITYASAEAPPVFIAHGRDDAQVDVAQSRMLNAALSQSGASVEYLETEGDHVFVGAPVVREVTQSTLAFLHRFIGTVTASPLDPDIREIERRMAATGDFPIFVDEAGRAVDGPTARARGIRLRDNFYPRQFFDVESVTDSTIPGPAGQIPIRIQKPLGGSDATVVYFHGGGWIIGDLDSHQGNASRIAAHSGAYVVQVDYRLAPENPFPAGADDALAAVEWVAANIESFGGDPAKLVVAGDSAGGNLAAVVAQQCRDKGIPLAAQFLIYPATDFTTMAGTDMEQQYLGPDSAVTAHHSRVSPALAVRLDSVAPAFIGVGEHDFLHQDNLEFARRLREAGVNVVLRTYPSLNHGFFSYGAISEAADTAAEQMCQDLRSILHL